MKRIVPLFLAALTFIFISNPVLASNVKIESVRTVQEYSDAWCIRGMVRNVENHPIKGYVKIKFLNSLGDVVRSHSASVNDGDSIAPGQATFFEYYADPKEFKNVVNFQVIFKDR